MNLLGNFENFFTNHKTGRAIKNFRLMSDGDEGAVKIDMTIATEISNKSLIKLFGDYVLKEGCSIVPDSFFSDWAQMGLEVKNCKKSFSILITNDVHSKNIIISCDPALLCCKG